MNLNSATAMELMRLDATDQASVVRNGEVSAEGALRRFSVAWARLSGHRSIVLHVHLYNLFLRRPRTHPFSENTLQKQTNAADNPSTEP